MTTELNSLLEFLRALYVPSSLDEFRDHLVKNLHRLIPCDIATYDEMDPSRHISIDRASPSDAFPPAAARSWEQVMHEHPVLMHMRRTGDLSAYRVSDFYSETEYHRRAIYQEHYKKISIEDALCKGIRVSGPVAVGCAVHRSSRTFSDSDRKVLDLIGPHLTQAWQNATRITTLRREMGLLRRTFDQLRHGVIILGPGARVRMMNGLARSLLKECFGTWKWPGRRLPEQLRLWVGHQLSRVDSADSLQPRIPLLIRLEDKQVQFRLIADSECYWLLVDEHRNCADPAALLKMGLTRRETEVLMWVTEGKTNAEISTILALSPRTVQKHMEHIMAKLAVETRTAAARIALQARDSSNDEPRRLHSQ